MRSPATTHKLPKQLTTVMLAVIPLSTAQARIGQTPKEVIQDAGREKAVSVQWAEILGRTMLRVQYHDDVILHLFGNDGREIAFYYYATKGLKPKDVDNIQRIYRTTWHGTGTEGGHFSWESDSGLYMAAERLETSDYLAIFDMTRKQEIPEIRSAIPVAALASTPTPVLAPAPTTGSIVPQQPYYSPPPASSPAIASTTADQKDCLVVATEAYARLQKTAYWAKIAGFTWRENGKVIGGHAVVFYQPTQNSNVWMYDSGGSYEIHTKSHELSEITYVLSELLSRTTIRIESLRWLENDDSKHEFASSQSNQQPTWSAIGDSENTKSATEPALIWRIIGGVIVAGVGVFLLGLGLQALFWIVCIAILIVTLVLSGCGRIWAKLTSSLSRARKIDEAQVLELHAIRDDPVERALERVRRKKQ